MKYKPFIIISFLAILGASIRLIPHLPNVAPIAALGLIVSAYFGFRYSFGVVMLAMFFSDLSIGFYTWPVMIAVYGSFTLSAVIGFFLKKRRTLISILYASLLSSFMFFLITNFAVWNFGTMYPHTLSGLMEAYAMAIPFFKNTLFGDFAYTAVFFACAEGILYALRQRAYLTTSQIKA